MVLLAADAEVAAGHHGAVRRSLKARDEKIAELEEELRVANDRLRWAESKVEEHREALNMFVDVCHDLLA